MADAEHTYFFCIMQCVDKTFCNFRLRVNFGQEEPWFAPDGEFKYIGHIPLHERIQGLLPPAQFSDCEVSACDYNDVFYCNFSTRGCNGTDFQMTPLRIQNSRNL